MTEVVNLTPHSITIVGEEDSVIATIEPSGSVARVKTTSKDVGAILIGGSEIPVSETTFGEVEGLPPEQEGTFYVVSGLVKVAAGRQDVLSPGGLVRDDQGRVIGCRGLSR